MQDALLLSPQDLVYKSVENTFIKPSYFSWTLAASSYSGQNFLFWLLTQMCTRAFLTGFYCHFDHPEQYQTMLLPVKNGRLTLTCKCTNYT